MVAWGQEEEREGTHASTRPRVEFGEHQLYVFSVAARMSEGRAAASQQRQEFPETMLPALTEMGVLLANFVNLILLESSSQRSSRRKRSTWSAGAAPLLSVSISIPPGAL